MSEMTKDHETLDEHENAGRRRLVRGVVAFAPLVLTLRSGGALAAASCTGAAKYLSVTLGGSGQIPDGITVESTDVCYTKVTECESNSTKLSTTPNSYSRLGTVQQSTNDKKYYCTGGSNKQTVAILSSQSAGSLL